MIADDDDLGQNPIALCHWNTFITSHLSSDTNLSVLNNSVAYQIHFELKADRPHPHYYWYKPPDYRHKDKHLRLVMTR